MSKTKISEFSQTASQNTDINSININEGCPPSSINNAIRELMKQIKDFQVGAQGDGLTVSTLVATTATVTNIEATNLTIGGTSVLQALYPVGSIYMNATNSTNPGTLLGFGTWTAFGAGRVPVGFDSGDSNFNAAEKTGGSKDAIVVSHTHTFSATTNTTGSHQHAAPSAPSENASPRYPFGSGGGDGGEKQTSGGNYTVTRALTNSAGDHSHTVSGTTDSTGSSGTNANLQPYITVYMWKRVS
jgi:hypothetical protein